jgi:hypothetical protein
MFFARLGLFRDDAPLTADAYPYGDRQWRVTVHTPMASNAAFVLYDCEDEGYKVKSFVNAYPHPMPGCEDYVCDWETLRAVWEPIAEGCDMEEICRWP